MATSSDNLRVDGARLWESLMDMAKIGALPGGGCGRLALTDDDKRARDLFASWCERAGCAVTMDEMGNMFARRPGRNPDLPPVAAGSHLDTQPHGGKFDGVFGVLAALEVVRTLNDAGVETEAPLEVINWTNEEGSRFAPAMIASGVFARLFERDFAYRIESSDGATLGDELERIGYKGAESCGEHPLSALFEAHIEQGPILEQAGVPIGVVSGAQGQRWYDIEVRGQDSHAGTTPMPARKDALSAAARMAVRLEDITLGKAPHAVGTVGRFDVSPNSRNTIPGEVRFSVDIRHPDADILASMDAEMRASFNGIAQRAGVEVIVDQIWEKPPIEFDPRCVEAVREAAARLGYDHQDIVSGAGHDACQVCTVAPTGMILRAVRRRHQSQRDRERDAGGSRDGLQRAAARHACDGGSRPGFSGNALSAPAAEPLHREPAGNAGDLPSFARRWRRPQRAPAVNPFVLGVVAMASVVAASNFLVRIPINDWLTWGALSYPIAFLVTDLINRRLGPDSARRVVYVGFACGVALSLLTSTGRIALASGTAFLLAQLADIWLYDRMRRLAWWRAPLVSSTLASGLDTALFFTLAFAFTGLPWVTWAIGDYGVKIAVAGAMLVPFRLLMGERDLDRVPGKLPSGAT